MMKKVHCLVRNCDVVSVNTFKSGSCVICVYLEYELLPLQVTNNLRIVRVAELMDVGTVQLMTCGFTGLRQVYV